MELLSRLQSEFGETVSPRVATESDAVDGVQPQAIAAPRDEEAARELVHFCGRENVAFVPRGGGTKLHIGAPPLRCDLIISTENLTQIFDHDEGNATVTAGAGISLEVLDAEMRQRGQFVPLWVGSFQQATLGGVVAANYSDCTKLKYGSPRDLVTGLHAVLSDGRLIKAGSKVVKNVSGYDLSKLLIGSLGTLGVITQATVRLRPCTSKNTHWWREYDNLEEAAAQAWEVANGAFAPVSLGVSALPQNNYYALYVHLEGSESEIETQLSRLPEYKLNNPFWHHNRYWRLAVHLPLKNAEKWLHIARELDVVQFSWEAALGTVIAHFDTVEIDVENLRAEAERLGGFLIVERAPAEVKTPELVWGAPRGDWALMKKLKQSYDTANVCAPGRFVGGL